MPRKPQTTAFWVGRLPHWEVEGGRYFITLHLAGAIPAIGRTRIQQIAAQLASASNSHAPEWLRVQRAIFGEMEGWLDRAEWNPMFRKRELAQMVIDAINHRHQRGDWHMFEYVVMPTHVHLFCEIGAQGLKAVMEDFKCWTAHQSIGPVRQTGPGDPTGNPLRSSRSASGTYRFWQREWFDHWSRSDEEDERIILYIRNNPVKAGLVEDYVDWPYGSWSQRQ
jgi:putative transposase